MKIAVFHNLWAGGAKRALYEMVRGLTARGHEIDVFTLSSSDETFLPLAPVAHGHHTEAVAWPPLLQTRWLPLALQYVNLHRRLKQLDALREAQARVADRIDAGGYDLAFIHHDYMVKAPYLLHQLRTPTVYYCQEPLRIYYECPPDRPSIARRGFKGWVRTLWYAPIERIFAQRHRHDDFQNARAAGLILANSDYSRESIQRAYGRPAKLAPLGVDTSLFRRLSDVPTERAVICVGRFEPNKSQALVIEAVARLPQGNRPRVILVGESTGTTAYRDHLVSRARELDVALDLLEHVSDEALVKAYNRAAVAVYLPVMEPLGFVPLEAAACGVPTIGVREAGVRETVRDGETGLLVERDAGAVASAIATLLADEPLRARLGAQALADVQANWSWERSVSVLEQRFASFLSEQGAAALNQE